MDLHERGEIQREAESLLKPENKIVLESYKKTKDQTAQDLFGKSLLELNDNQFDQATSLARKIVLGAEEVLATLSELEDWLIENRRK